MVGIVTSKMKVMKYFSSDVENILQSTIIEVEASSLEQTYTTVLEQVLDIRRKLLERLRMIRKDNVSVCDSRIDQGRKLTELRVSVEEILQEAVSVQVSAVSGLRAISRLLITFRAFINTEVMRTILLPEQGSGL